MSSRTLSCSEAGLTSEYSSNVNGDGACFIEDDAEFAYTSDEASDEAVAMQEAVIQRSGELFESLVGFESNRQERDRRLMELWFFLSAHNRVLASDYFERVDYTPLLDSNLEL